MGFIIALVFILLLLLLVFRTPAVLYLVGITGVIVLLWLFTRLFWLIDEFGTLGLLPIFAILGGVLYVGLQLDKKWKHDAKKESEELTNELEELHQEADIEFKAKETKQKFQEIERLRDSGIITDDEYKKKRENIINNL